MAANRRFHVQQTRAQSPKASGSTSESEESFVSAKLDHISSNQASNTDQSETESARARISSSPRRKTHKTLSSTVSTSPARNGSVTSRPSRYQKGSDVTITSPFGSDDARPLSTRAYFSPQSGASGTDFRSPAYRRPPASRSSHGIETFSGPPPALSTRRSYNVDTLQNSTSLESASQDSRPSNRLRTNEHEPDAITFSALQKEVLNEVKSKSDKIVRPTKTTATAIPPPGMVSLEDSPVAEEEEYDETIYAEPRQEGTKSGGRGMRDELQSQGSRQDLFLDLARANSVSQDSPDMPQQRSERRRSRLGNQNRAANASTLDRPTSSGGTFLSKATLNLQPFDSDPMSHFTGANNVDSYADMREEAARRRPYAASAHPLDQRHRSRRKASTNTSSFEYPLIKDEFGSSASPNQPLSNGRRRSILADSSASVTQPQRPSTLPHAAKHGKFSSSPFPLQVHQPADSESTTSTNAPSTLWDELDDLKSRIRSLEVIGRLPASSNAAIATAFGERPGTANTTMTNTSSSPKNRSEKIAAPAPVVEENNDINTLLHSALQKSKGSLAPAVGNALAVTVSEALSLATCTQSLSKQSALPGVTDRQLRRKTENICRSLMDLCIVLAEPVREADKPGQEYMPVNTEQNLLSKAKEAVSQNRFARAVSEDPELRSSSRVMSRLEARRASLQASTSVSPRASEQETPTPLANRLDRTASALRRTENEERTSIIKRSPSRANTELGQTRSAIHARTPREYVSNHPLPNHPHRSPSVQSSLPQRKSYFGSNTSSPGTPYHTQLHGRRIEDAGITPSSADNLRLAEARQRRLASLGQSTPTT